MDMERTRRESIRWHIMVAVNSGAPHIVAETLILSAIQSIPVECTALELRKQMDYLEDRRLLELQRHEGAPWTATLTRHGVDLVEYTIEAEPGIARPKKYW
jgi:hypothetical protein